MPATQYTDDGVGHHYSGRTAVFKTTVHNGTNGPIDTSPLVIGQPAAFAGPDGNQVQKAGGWDSEPQSVLNPDTPMLQPGQSYSWEWGLDDGKGIADLTVQYQVTLPSYQGGDQTMQWEGNVR